VAIGDDLSVYFNTDDFGVAVSIDGEDVVGILDQEYEEMVEVAGYNPELQVPSANLPAGIAYGSDVVIGPRNFKVRAIRPDVSQRVTILDLEYISTT
jgi:hypothetical protein